MTDRDSSANEIAEIDFEVGHVSIIRAEPTTVHNPPRTHDWKVYLRSADVNADLSCLIQRCVFNLHPEFPHSKREVKATPFAIQETGYAGFYLPIDIHFKTKKEPKKFRIEYDLDLHTNVEGLPNRQKESSVRKYRCTFHNPDPDLRQKILAAGGKIRDNNSIASHHHETDESNAADEMITSVSEPIVRHSPPQKRPHSPVQSHPSINAKKVKTEQAIINSKKKQQTSSTTKTELSSKSMTNTLNMKKPQLIQTTKSSPTIDDKQSKHFHVKELNQTSSTNNSSADDSSSTTKPPRPTLKIKCESSTNLVLPKKKEPIPSPSKSSSQPPPSTTTTSIKKSTSIPSSKPVQKFSTKLESTSTINKSPSNVHVKRESSPITNTSSNSNSTNPTASISSLKKIPKKLAPPPPPPPPPPTIEKRTRSPMTPPSSSRNFDRDSHRHQSSSKCQSNSKRDRPLSPPLSNNNSSSSRSSSGNRSSKHSTTSSSNRGRSRSRSRSRSRHSTHHTSRSHHSSNSSRHSSQQKDRTNHHQSKSSHQTNRRTPTPSKSIRISPLRANQSHQDLPSTSINTPQSRPESVEPPATTAITSPHVFHSEDDHTQTPMDIDGQSDDDRRLTLSDEHDQTSPLSLNFIAQRKNLVNRNSHSDHSYTSSDLNESYDESNFSLNENTTNNNTNDDDDENLPFVLTDDDLRSKLIFIYKRFKLNSSNDLAIFITFFKRHHFIDTTSKFANDMFTCDLFSLQPILIEELATDLGYTNRAQQ